MGYLIQAITKLELTEIMLKWAKNLGWRYSTEDVDAYFRINGTNIYSLKLFNIDSNEYELIGCISLSSYHSNQNISQASDNCISSIGLFIIAENHRGHKHGSQLLGYALKELKRSSIISLNSVPRVSSYYKRNGFFTSGTVNSHFSLASKNISSEISKKLDNKVNLIVADQTFKEEIFKYDSELFNNIPERKKFLDVWLTRADAIVVAYLNENKIEGYGVLTICDDNKDTKSYRISPMIADSIDIAANLFYKIFKLINNSNFEAIELNAFSNINSHLTDLFKYLGFNRIEDGNTELMVTNLDKSININPTLFKVIAMNPLEFPHEKLQLTINIPSL